MSSKYEKTQGTKINISENPATEPNPTGATWQSINCSTKELSYTGGQKSDIDTTTLCSTEQEMTNGLAAPGEMTVSGNWSADEEGQNTLRTAYDTDTLHAFQVIFPSGNGYAFLAEVAGSAETLIFVPCVFSYLEDMVISGYKKAARRRQS